MIRKNKLKYYCKRFAAGLLVALLVFSSGGNSVWAASLGGADNIGHNTIGSGTIGGGYSGTLSGGTTGSDNSGTSDGGTTGSDNSGTSDGGTTDSDNSGTKSNGNSGEINSSESSANPNESTEQTVDTDNEWECNTTTDENGKTVVTLIKYSGSDTSLTIPKYINAIGDEAFKDNTQLKEITIPGEITTIGNNAFEGCSNSMTLKISCYNNPETFNKIGISSENIKIIHLWNWEKNESADGHTITLSGICANKNNYYCNSENRIITMTLPDFDSVYKINSNYSIKVEDNYADSDPISIIYDCKKTLINQYNQEARTTTYYNVSPTTAGEYTAYITVSNQDGSTITASFDYTIQRGKPTELLTKFSSSTELFTSSCQAQIGETQEVVQGTISKAVPKDESYKNYTVIFRPDDLINYTSSDELDVTIDTTSDGETIGGNVSDNSGNPGNSSTDGNVITPGTGDTTLVPGDENGDSTGDDILVTPGDDGTLNPDDENNDDNTNDGTNDSTDNNDGDNGDNDDKEGGSTTINNGRRKAGSPNSDSDSDSGSGSDSGSDSDETLGTDSVDTNENNLFDTIANTIADFMSNKNDIILGGIVNIKEAISTGKITRKLAIWMFSVGTITLGTIIYITYPLIKRRKKMKVQPADAPEKDDTENNEMK
jgi:hypothetical protein